MGLAKVQGAIGLLKHVASDKGVPGTVRLPGRGPVEAVPLRLQDRRSEDWDSLAQECGGSFQSSYARLRRWSLQPRRHLTTFDFHRSGRKIGQCAVSVSAGRRVFVDPLALRPGFEQHWRDCMAAALAHLGPGRYRYGWRLALEQSRAQELATLPGASVEGVRPIVVQAVDFSGWPSWEAYWASTSSNTRRNAKRGEKNGLSISVRTGFGCLADALAITRLRATMCARKGIEFDRLYALAHYVGGHLFAPDYRLAAICTDGKQPLACFVGYEFGPHTYYLAGASLGASDGAAWYLQKRMLQRAWERSGDRARFVAGNIGYVPLDEGVLRSRKSINVADFATSVVTFRYEQP